MTDPLGQSQVLPYLCGLSGLGYKIHLISAEKKENYALYHKTIQNICNESSISWHPVRYSRFPPVIATIYDLSKVRILASRLQQIHHFDLIHCRSYLATLCGFTLKAKFKTPVLFDMRGLWADEKLDGRIWDIRNPLYKKIYDFFKAKEKQFIKLSDGIISLTRKAWPILEKSGGGLPNGQVRETIPCCTDEHHFDPATVDEEEVASWKSRLNISDDDFLMVYLGSISTWYLPDEMLHFFKLLLTVRPHAKFLIVSTESPQPVLATASRLGIPKDRIIFTSSTRKRLPALLKLSDIGICFIKPAFSKNASSPTKLGEFLCMGIPVVCNRGIGDTDEVIQNIGGGVLCDPFNDESMRAAADSILKIASDRDPAAIRTGAIRYFSLERGVQLYAGVYRQILDQA